MPETSPTTETGRRTSPRRTGTSQNLCAGRGVRRPAGRGPLLRISCRCRPGRHRRALRERRNVTNKRFVFGFRMRDATTAETVIGGNKKSTAVRRWWTGKRSATGRIGPSSGSTERSPTTGSPRSADRPNRRLPGRARHRSPGGSAHQVRRRRNVAITLPLPFSWPTSILRGQLGVAGLQRHDTPGGGHPRSW